VSGSTTELTSGYKTEGQQTFFRYIDAGVLRSGTDTTGSTASINGATFAGPDSRWLAHADGERIRVSPQATYYNGSLGVLSEYVWQSQEVSVGSTNQRKTRLENDAWQVAASYLLTGEDSSFKGVKPKRNFDLSSGGWGAWEIVGRYSEQNIDDKAFTFGSLDGSDTAWVANSA
jgi:phosphate-selective porin